MTRPHITLIKVDKLANHYEVRPGKNKRDWLDNTRDSHGYVCQPMSTVGFHGWEFVLPHDVKFIWDGISDEMPDHVTILEGKYINGENLVDTGTANGTITFNMGYIFKTDPDHHILMSGAPNVFIDGVTPMTAILQSDWYHWNAVQFCWKINKANEVITIPKGTPFLFIRNYPKTLLEDTEFIIRDATTEEVDFMLKYGDARDSFHGSDENSWKWQQMYKRGVDHNQGSYLEKPYKPSPSKPIIQKSAPRLIQQRNEPKCPFNHGGL